MEEVIGRVGCAETGSREPSRSASALSGFDPARLEFRPDSKGEFDELVARFGDGGVFIETMTDQSVYVDFQWDDGLHCQLWISAGGRAKLRYYHEHDQGDPPRYTAQGVDRRPDLPDYTAIAMEAAKPTRRETGSARKGDSAGRKASPKRKSHD